LEQTGQRADAVHLRHGHIQDDHVGVLPLHLVDGLARPACTRDDLHVRLSLHPAADHGAYDNSVIDHHDARAVAFANVDGSRRSQGNSHYRLFDQQRRSGCQISPTSWNLASTISLSNGFMMYSLAPACSARAMCATSFSLVQKTTFGRS